MRQVASIEVGQYQGKAGFPLYYDDDNKEHFLFNVNIASDLAIKLLAVVAMLKQSPGFKDAISVGEHIDVKIKGGKDELQ